MEMSHSKLELRINALFDDIEKLRKSIARTEGQLSKQKRQLKSRGVDMSNMEAVTQKAYDLLDYDLLWDLEDYQNHLDELSRNELKIQELERKLAELQKKYAREEE